MENTKGIKVGDRLLFNPYGEELFLCLTRGKIYTVSSIYSQDKMYVIDDSGTEHGITNHINEGIMKYFSPEKKRNLFIYE